jgi:anion-transporting  ArsA/GET3 family ATPase
MTGQSPIQGGNQRALDDRRFLFVTGKGGVGKTTVCASMALAMAERGMRVLVAMSGAHERLSSILGTAPIGHDVSRVAERIWATKISPERAMEEYGELVIGVKTIARAVFDNRYTNAFFRAVPGLFDWAMLGKAWWHTTEEDDKGRTKYDIVLFDAPSTGHGLDMLRVPKVILDIVPPGVLRKDAEAAWEMFRDPVRSGAVVVTLAEEMPTTETIELVTALRGELGLPVHRLVVNAMMEPLFVAEERESLVRDEELLDVRLTRDDPAERALSVAARRAARERLQARCRQRLERELGLDTMTLPFLLDGAGTPEGARRLAKLL